MVGFARTRHGRGARRWGPRPRQASPSSTPSVGVWDTFRRRIGGPRLQTGELARIPATLFATPTFLARPWVRAEGAARGVWIPSRPRPGPRRDGVLQPGEPRARRRAASDADHRRQPDRPVRRTVHGQRRSSTGSSRSRRPAVHREPRWLFQTGQPRWERVLGWKRIHSHSAALHGIHPSRRFRYDGCRSQALGEGRELGAL